MKELINDPDFISFLLFWSGVISGLFFKIIRRTVIEKEKKHEEAKVYKYPMYPVRFIEIVQGYLSVHYVNDRGASDIMFLKASDLYEYEIINTSKLNDVVYGKHQTNR